MDGTVSVSSLDSCSYQWFICKWWHTGLIICFLLHFSKMFQKLDLWYLQPWVFFVFFFNWTSPSKQSQDIPQYPDISHLQKIEDNLSRFTSSEATFMTKFETRRKQDLRAMLRGERHHSEELPAPPHLSAKYSKSRILKTRVPLIDKCEGLSGSP